MATCKVCHQERPHHALGKCQRCYMREYMRTYLPAHPDMMVAVRVRSYAWRRAHPEGWKEINKRSRNNKRPEMSAAQVLGVMGC